MMKHKQGRWLAAAGLSLASLTLGATPAGAQRITGGPTTTPEVITTTPDMVAVRSCSMVAKRAPIPVVVLMDESQSKSDGHGKNEPDALPGSKDSADGEAVSFETVQKSLGDEFALGASPIMATDADGIADEIRTRRAQIAEKNQGVQPVVLYTSEDLSATANGLEGADIKFSVLNYGVGPGRIRDGYRSFASQVWKEVDDVSFVLNKVDAVPERRNSPDERAQTGEAEFEGAQWNLSVDPAPPAGLTALSGRSVRVELLDGSGAHLGECESSGDGFPANVNIKGLPEDKSFRVRVEVDGKSRPVKDLRAIRCDPNSDDCDASSFDRDDSALDTGGRASGSDGNSSSSSTLPLVLVGLAGVAIGLGGPLLARRLDPNAPVSGGAPFGHDPMAPGAFSGAIPPPAFGMPVPPVASVDEHASFHPVPAPAVFQPDPVRPAPPGWTGTVYADRSVRLGDLGMNRLLPQDSAAGRSWAYEAEGIVAGAGWFEKKAGRGEDAEPTLRIKDDGTMLLGAYDGTGGAGAAIARRLRDGTELTGAYVSSRFVRDLVENWGIRRIGQGPLGDPSELTRMLTSALSDEAATIPDTGGVRGSLSKKLPTTAAVLAVTPIGERGVRAEAIWAGDSRAFVLTAHHGLQTLTIDDTRETDALALIRNDQPMTNLISADKAFRLNYHAIDRVGPAVFLVATDGCFGYVATPAHFEYLVLEALMGSQHAGDWSNRVVEKLSQFAADDVSFSMASAGFNDFAALKESFRSRYDYLDQEHWQVFQAVGDDPAERERLREQSWAVYRETYEALVFGPETAGA